MAHKYEATAKNPLSIEVEMKISMPLEDWVRLKKSLTNDWPSFEFRNAINAMINQMEKHFCPTPAEKEEEA